MIDIKILEFPSGFTNLGSIKVKVPLFVSSRDASLDAGMHVVFACATANSYDL